MTDKGEKVRIKAKYAEYIRAVAEQRDESFLDALYHVIDTHKQLQKVNTVVENVPLIANTTVDDEVDISDFE